jgi:hypothetical protein
MDWIILVKGIREVLLLPIITECKYNTPIRVYYNSFGVHNILKSHKGVLHNLNKT